MLIYSGFEEQGGREMSNERARSPRVEFKAIQSYMEDEFD